MNNKKRIFSILIISIMIMSIFNINIYANDQTQKNNILNQLAKSYIKENTVLNTFSDEINQKEYKNIDVFIQKSKKIDNIEDIEIAKFLANYCNIITYDENNKFNENTFLQLLSAKEIYTKTQYFQVDEKNRSVKSIDKFQYDLAKQTPLVEDTETFNYMKINTAAMYTKPSTAGGRIFRVMSNQNWLKVPIWSLTDSLGLITDGTYNRNLVAYHGYYAECSNLMCKLNGLDVDKYSTNILNGEPQDSNSNVTFPSNGGLASFNFDFRIPMHGSAGDPANVPHHPDYYQSGTSLSYDIIVDKSKSVNVNSAYAHKILATSFSVALSPAASCGINVGFEYDGFVCEPIAIPAA